MPWLKYSTDPVTHKVLKESSFLSRDGAIESLLSMTHLLFCISFSIPSSFCFEENLS